MSLLLPNLMRAINTPDGKMIFHYLSCADQLHQHLGKNTLDRSILCACLIFPLLEHELKEQYLSKNQIPHIGDITLIASTLIKELLVHAFPHFPRRVSSIMVSILVTQYRITPLSGRRHYPERLLRHKDFDFALKFLKLRALVDIKYVDIYTSVRNQYRQLERHSHRKHHAPPSHQKDSTKQEQVHGTNT